jgi:hypothetical protein
MDADTKDRFAIRCIVVSTRSGMVNVARTYRHDQRKLDRLRAATLERGNVLLTELERDHALSRKVIPMMRAARVALAH